MSFLVTTLACLIVRIFKEFFYFALRVTHMSIFYEGCYEGRLFYDIIRVTS